LFSSMKHRRRRHEDLPFPNGVNAPSPRNGISEVAKMPNGGMKGNSKKGADGQGGNSGQGNPVGNDPGQNDPASVPATLPKTITPSTQAPVPATTNQPTIPANPPIPASLPPSPNPPPTDATTSTSTTTANDIPNNPGLLAVQGSTTSPGPSSSGSLSGGAQNSSTNKPASQADANIPSTMTVNSKLNPSSDSHTQTTNPTSSNDGSGPPNSHPSPVAYIVIAIILITILGAVSFWYWKRRRRQIEAKQMDEKRSSFPFGGMEAFWTTFERSPSIESPNDFSPRPSMQESNEESVYTVNSFSFPWPSPIPIMSQSVNVTEQLDHHIAHTVRFDLAEDDLSGVAL